MSGTYSIKKSQEVQLPAKEEVLERARKIFSDPNARIEPSVSCVSEDPVIVLELLKAVHSIEAAGSRVPITTPRACIQRLGNQLINETLEMISERPQLTDPGVAEWYDKYRSYSYQVSKIASIICDIKRIRYADECKVAALFTYLGDMLSVAYLQQDYVVQADAASRKRLNYRLTQDYGFNPEDAGIEYLKAYGIPDVLLFPLERSTAPKDKNYAIMRPICNAAQEIYEANMNGKLEKYAPNTDLPSNSALRLLQLNAPQLVRMHNQIAEYLAPNSTK
ncbi:MAG: HDOD domain-containing protein [Deltaproteobacteria bacterium]|nr:HDOD domain-containing protein [Deltaproteobacteria bacterium]